MNIDYSQINSLQDDLIEIERDACKNSLYEFLLSFWDIIDTEKFIDAPHIKVICDEVQEVIERAARREKTYDLVINVPPGSSKTSMVLKAAPAWAWVIDDTLRMISSSHSESLSVDCSIASRDIIQSRKYQLLFPHVQIRKDKGAKKAYDTLKGGRRISTSTGSAITGNHAHIKFMDDLQDASNAESEADRYSAIKHMKSLFTREIEKGKSANILIMQRLHEEDCASFLLEKAGRKEVKHICLPARLSDKVNPPELIKLYKNGLLDPIRMSEEVLEEKEDMLGTYDFECQFQQETTPPEGGLVKRKWFRYIEAEELVTTEPFHFWIDTAFEKKKLIKSTGEGKNDPSGFMSTTFAHGNMYITDYREVYKELPDLVRFVKEYTIAQGYSSRSMIHIEPKASGKSTVQTVRKFTKLNVKEIEPEKGKRGGKDSKATELRNTAPVIESGRVYLVKGPWNRKFLDRICGFPRAAHDEAVDLLCYAKKKYFGKGNPGKRKNALEKAKKLLG